MTEQKKTHLDSPTIAKLLERCRCLWAETVPGVGELTAYATASGLVIFQDFERGGWTMLSECPSNTHAGNVAEIEAMLDGKAGVRPGPGPGPAVVDLG